MAMGRRKPEQKDLWLSAEEVAKPAAHPSCSKVNAVLDELHFDRRVESLCQRFYPPVMGRPSIAPGCSSGRC